MPPHKLLDAALQAGPYGKESKWKLSIEQLKAHPSGIDFGPLEPSCPERLQTHDKRIPRAIHEALADIYRLQSDIDEHVGGYRLIGRRHVGDNNSWMHNHRRLVKGKDRCLLLMHPDDVAKKGWNEGIHVTITSRVGSISAKLKPLVDVMPGVISLPHGYGHGLQGTRSKVANLHAGVSCNDVTDEKFLDQLSGNAAVNGVPVQLSV